MEVLLFFVFFCIYWVQSWDYEYSMHTLNILSLNVNGLNSAVKRTRVLEYLHRKSISCALIQETHLKQSDVARFQNKYYKLIAFSCAQNKTKGVLILVNRKLNLTIEHIGSDEKGRFVFIRCKIYNNRLALVSIYGPNETDSAFLTQKAEDFISSMSQQKSYAAALRGDGGGAAAAVSSVRREGRDGRDGLGPSCPEGDDGRMNMDAS